MAQRQVEVKITPSNRRRPSRTMWHDVFESERRKVGKYLYPDHISIAEMPATVELTGRWRDMMRIEDWKGKPIAAWTNMAFEEFGDDTDIEGPTRPATVTTCDGDKYVTAVVEGKTVKMKAWYIILAMGDTLKEMK